MTEPARPRRFARCETAVVLTPTGEQIEACLAERFAARLLGLAALDAAAARPLLFPGCRSIHTHGMRFALDVCFLEGVVHRAQVLHVVAGLTPGRHAHLPGDRRTRRSRREPIAVLELPAGRAAALGIEPGADLAIAAAVQLPISPPSRVPGAFSTSSNGPAGAGSGAGSPGAGGSP